MVVTAARLGDHLIPQVAVRQWVLSFPIPLRILFAAHPGLLTLCCASCTGSSRGRAQSRGRSALHRAGFRSRLNAACRPVCSTRTS
jgi:hypothetical protein